MPRIPIYGGRQIGRSSLQPADVLLYSPGAIQNGVRVPFGHYRMYAGDGMTIESGGGGVHMDTLAAKPPAMIRTYLAKGGVVTQPTIALLGEAGPEAVIPLGKGNAAEAYYDQRTFHVHVQANAAGQVDVRRLMAEINALEGKATKAARRGRVRGRRSCWPRHCASARDSRECCVST